MLEEESATVTVWIPSSHLPGLFCFILDFCLPRSQVTHIFSLWVTLLWFYWSSYFDQSFSHLEMLGNLWVLSMCLCFSCAEAHIWAWMLNMPHSPPKEGTKTPRESVTDAKPVAVRYWIKYMNILRLCTPQVCVSRIFQKLQDINLGHVWWKPHVFSRLYVNMTGPVDAVSPVIATLVCVCPYEERATTAGGTPSAYAGSAACLGSVTAASPMDKRVSVHGQTYLFKGYLKLKHSLNLEESESSVCLDLKMKQNLTLSAFFIQGPGVKMTGIAGHLCAVLDTMASRYARGGWPVVRAAMCLTVAWHSASTRFVRVMRGYCVGKEMHRSGESKYSKQCFIQN